MIIKPDLGSRIFWGVAGGVTLILACAGLPAPIPGLLFTCLGLSITVFSFRFAFGAAHTRIDDAGVFQRNPFFVSKKLAWHEIESGGIFSERYTHKDDSSGWTEERTNTYVALKGSGVAISVNAKSSGAGNWRQEMRRIAKEKLGDKFDG